jgi:hypothetical protein
MRPLVRAVLAVLFCIKASEQGLGLAPNSFLKALEF